MLASKFCRCLLHVNKPRFAELRDISDTVRLISTCPTFAKIRRLSLNSGRELFPTSYGTLLRTCPRRNCSSRRKQDDIPSHVTTIDDIGEGFLNEPRPNDIRKKDGHSIPPKRIKVKFSGKNSLVSADAANLIGKLYQTYPQLVDFEEYKYEGYLQQMSSYAIDVESATEMLIKYPSLLGIHSSKVEGILGGLRSIGMSEKDCRSLIRRRPQLLDIPPKRLTSQFAFLKTYLTVQESVEVLKSSVDIFMQSEENLKMKLEYLIKGMSHETFNIVSCKALSFSLKHIKTRHELLIRAGFFKPIPYRKLIKVLEKEYKDKNKPRHRYFKPIYVVCYGDQDFLKTCTNNTITLNELTAFEELYEAEMDMSETLQGEDLYEDGDEEEDDDGLPSTVSLVRGTNSTGFFNDVEQTSCYF